MYNTALRITGAADEAEDVLQEAFVSAFQNLSSYRQEASFGAWLKRIVINKALSQVQKRKDEMVPLESQYEEIATETTNNDLEGLTYSVDGIKEGMKRLPSGFRSVLSLYLFEGYDHKEISQILGITESTSKSQYKRAKDKLKKMLKEDLKIDNHGR